MAREVGWRLCKLSQSCPKPSISDNTGKLLGGQSCGIRFKRTEGLPNEHQRIRPAVRRSECHGSIYISVVWSLQVFEISRNVFVLSGIVLYVSSLFRSGFVVLELPDLPSGKYKVTVSTFYPMQEGPYILTVKSTASVKIVPQ